MDIPLPCHKPFSHINSLYHIQHQPWLGIAKISSILQIKTFSLNRITTISQCHVDSKGQGKDFRASSLWLQRALAFQHAFAIKVLWGSIN